jgi:hypothetical protein
MSNEKRIDTIDLTPTWRGLLPALVELAVNGTTAEARKTAMGELYRLADAVDHQAKTETEHRSLDDGDYVLADGAGWFEVGNFAIRIAKTDEGVACDIYRNHDEMGEALAGCWALDRETEDK